MQPFGQPAAIQGLDLLTDAERKAVSRLLLSGERTGYHAGWHFADKSTAAIFDATPPTLKALNLCEWLEWYTAHLRADENWRSLITALHVNTIAEHGGQVEQFDAEAREYMVRTMIANVGGVERDWQGFWDYRRYAHDCAKACSQLPLEERRTFRATYTEALRVYEWKGEWVAFAAQLRSKYGVLHPGHVEESDHRKNFTGTSDIVLDCDAGWNPFIAYFDYYVEGLRYKDDGLTSNIRAAESEVNQGFDWIVQQRTALLQRQVRCDQFTMNVAQAVPPGDEEQARKVYGRFTHQCAAVQFPWWHEADQDYLASAEQWAAFTKKAGWLGNLGNGVSSLLQAFVQTDALIHNHDIKSAHSAIRLCLRFERWLSSGLVDAVEIGLASGKFAFSVRGQHVTIAIEVFEKSKSGEVTRVVAGEYRVLKKARLEPLQPVTGQSGHFTGVTMTKVEAVRDLEIPLGKLVVPMPADPKAVARLEGASGVVGNLANFLNAALAMQRLINMPEQDLHFFATRDVQSATWSIMQGVGSAEQVVQAVLRMQGKPALKLSAMVWASRLGAAGLALESAYGLQEGLTTLYSDESNALARLDQGDNVGGALEMVKGVGQLAAGIGGMGSAAAAVWGSLSLMAAPFSLVFCVGVLLVVGIEASIYARAGSGNRVQPLIDRVTKAKRSEFHLDERDHLTQREPQAPRLRQRLGGLNHVLNHERVA